MQRTPLETYDEGRTVKQAVKHGYKVRKLMFIGVRGAPDRLFGRDGSFLVIEFKREGKEPTLQQLRRHKELREDFGWEVFWADNYASACEILCIPT